MARYNGGAYVSLADSPSNSGASPPRATTASAAAVSATSTTSASASGHEYNELPVAQAQGEEDLAEQTTAASAAEASAELAEGVAPEQEGHAAGGGGSTKNKANSEAKRKKRGAEREKEGTDLTGGLPTTEGVFVGSPVTRQSEYSMPRMPRTVAPHTGPTVLAPSGDSRVDLGSSPPPYNPGGGATGRSGQHTVIVVNTANSGAPWEMWGPHPQQIVCPSCSFAGYTRVVQDPCSAAPLLAAACCCLVGLWPCSFIPFLVPDIRDTVHRCPNCNIIVGRSRQCF